MKTTEKMLAELVPLLTEMKPQEAIALCSKALGASEAQVHELAGLMSVYGFSEMSLAIARTLDASNEERPTVALEIQAVCAREFIFDPHNPDRVTVLKLARRFARLPE